MPTGKYFIAAVLAQSVLLEVLSLLFVLLSLSLMLFIILSSSFKVSSSSWFIFLFLFSCFSLSFSRQLVVLYIIFPAHMSSDGTLVGTWLDWVPEQVFLFVNSLPPCLDEEVMRL